MSVWEDIRIVLNTNKTHDSPVKIHGLFLCIVFAFHSPEGAQHQYSRSDRWNHRFSRCHSDVHTPHNSQHSPHLGVSVKTPTIIINIIIT